MRKFYAVLAAVIVAVLVSADPASAQVTNTVVDPILGAATNVMLSACAIISAGLLIWVALFGIRKLKRFGTTSAAG